MGVVEMKGATMPNPTIPNTAIEDLIGFRRDDEIMGHYVREIHEHLTLEDVQAVLKEAKLYNPKTSQKMFTVHKAADGVAGYAGYRHGSLAHWAALGVETLTGTIVSLAEFKTPRPFGPSTAPYQTLEELRRIVEEAITAAEEEDAPWSDQNKAIVRSWLAQTPYQIWCHIHELEGWAEDAVREALFDITRQTEDGKHLASNIQNEWERRVMYEWERDWKSQWDGSIPEPLA
jgi:hypothetical protein